MQVKFRHFNICHDFQFTVCTRYDNTTHILTVGYAFFNPKDKFFVKKTGNQLAEQRMNESPLTISFTRPSHYHITWAALNLIKFDLMRNESFGIPLRSRLFYYDWLDSYRTQLVTEEIQRLANRFHNDFDFFEEMTLVRILAQVND